MSVPSNIAMLASTSLFLLVTILAGCDETSTPQLQATTANLPDACGAEVEGARYRASSWLLIEKCGCPDGYSLIGADADCGNGADQHFKLGKLTGKGCSCAQNKACPPVTTQKGFNLEAYISKQWYIQQQMPTQYLDITMNYCVNAKYTKLEKPTFWGYTIQVRNQASKKDGTLSDSGDFLCAYGYDAQDPAKLSVAPCFLPKAASGPYWVLDYSEEEGYALISGGQPTLATPFGCRTGSGVNDAGLWIFTRQAKTNHTLVEKVRGIAAEQGFDLSVLNPVDHTNCTWLPAYQ